MLIKALSVLKLTGKTLDSYPKMEYNIHIIMLVSLLFFHKQYLGMLSLKGKYNNVSVNANHKCVCVCV